MVPPTSCRVSRVPQYSGYYSLQFRFRIQGFHFLRPGFPAVSGSLSLPSQGSFHLSFTVLYAIGHWLVFSLGGWSPRLPAGFLVSRSTPDTTRCNSDFEYKAFTFFGQAFLPVLLSFCSLIVVHYPEMHASRFRLFPFRSPLLRKSMFLSLPPGT